MTTTRFVVSSKKTINKVQVVRETSINVWVTGLYSYQPKNKETRINKNDDYFDFFDTYEEAKKIIIDYQLAEIAKHQEIINELNKK